MGEQNYDKHALVPRLRFLEFQQADGWEEKTLNEFLAESRNPSERNDPSRRITVRLHLQGVEHRACRGTESTEATNHFRRAAGQFIYGKQNIHKGAFGIIPTCLDGFETSQDLPCFDFKGDCNPQWLYYYFAREEIYGALELKMTGTGSKRLNENAFLSLKITAAGYKEQEKIADCLSSVDNLITSETQKLDTLKAHKKALMQLLFPREGESNSRLRFPDFRKADDWVEEKLEKLASRGSGHTPSKSNAEYYDGGVKWISLADSKRLDHGLIWKTEIEISAQGIKNSSAVLHPTGTVVLSRDAGVGKSAVMGTPMAVSQHFIAWTCNSERLLNWFLYYTLQRNKPLFERVASGSTIKTIGLPFFVEMRIRLPSPSEQKKIADCLYSLDDLIAAQSLKIDTLRTHKKSLMQQLFPVLDKESV